jgi:DNA excision repair protein ERCC-5
MIIFALLLGSDYTDGVKGIGIVNAMEILKVFNSFEKLHQFKKWAEHADILQDQENKTENMMKFTE